MKASVLIVDDDAGLRRALTDRVQHWGHHVTAVSGGEEALQEVDRSAYDLILLDLSMPGMSGLEVLDHLRERECESDVVVLTAQRSVETAVDAMKRGATDFFTKPADFQLLERVVDRALEKRRLARVNDALIDQARRRGALIEGTSHAMRELVDTATRAAGSDATLLLMGESGTGKQVVAEYIHRNSQRSDGPFVYVNTVAISDHLVESTLFGHEKGAFTGADRRKIGLLEGAQDGTVFFDEIGDISAGLQTKLLHFLESGQFERVGGTQSITVDCRVVAATNQDLAHEMSERRFREDLYYRLNVITLRLPPLRERPEDIPDLATTFLDRYAGELKRDGLRLAEPTLEKLKQYRWPGNVRQLRNAIERMVVLATGATLNPDLLPPEILDDAGPGETGEEGLPDSLDYRQGLADFKKRAISRALEQAGGNQTKAAELLGLQRTYLNRLMKDLGI
jgi:DNA-binding NtrC family response regulator